MAEDSDPELTGLFRELTRALIEATPEWWTEAMLRAEAEASEDVTPELSYDIRSKGFPRDIVEATEDIRRIVRELEVSEREAGRPWSSMAFRISQEEGRWRFTLAFEPVGLLDSPH